MHSKSLTGLAIMKLIDDNIIELDDPVQRHLPWFKLKDKQEVAQITIKHLLTHSSGFSTYTGLSISDKESKDTDSIRNNVESLSNVTLTALPGEKHQYSNANFLILGALIEEVTNQTYAEYMEQNVFNPLGMKKSAADYETAYEKGYLSGYQSWFGIPQKSSITYDNGGAPYGYYGLGIRISNPDSQDKMIWHSGSTPDSHAELFYIPKTGWGGVILTNKNNQLEEEGLYYLKAGIINILHGEQPVDIPKNTPTIQFITLGCVCLLVVLFIYLLLKLKSKKICKNGLWAILGIFCLILSITLIPLFINLVGSPWHAIEVFSPDIALLTIITVTLLAVNGLLAIRISFKNLKDSF